MPFGNLEERPSKHVFSMLPTHTPISSLMMEKIGKGLCFKPVATHKGSHFTGPVMRETHHNPSGKPSDLTINHPQAKITDLLCSLSLTKRLSQHYLLINTYILHSYINRAKKWIIWEQSQNDHCPEGLPSAEQRSFDSGY